MGGDELRKAHSFHTLFIREAILVFASVQNYDCKVSLVRSVPTARVVAHRAVLVVGKGDGCSAISPQTSEVKSISKLVLASIDPWG